MAQKNPTRGQDQEQQVFNRIVFHLCVLMFNHHDAFVDYNMSMVYMIPRAQQLIDRLRSGELDPDMIGEMMNIKVLLQVMVNNTMSCIRYIGSNTHSIVQRALNHVRENDPDLFQNETGPGDELLNRLFARARNKCQQAADVLKDLEFFIQDIKHLRTEEPNQEPPDFDLLIDAFCYLMFNTHDNFATWNGSLVSLIPQLQEVNARIKRNERITFDIIEAMVEHNTLLLLKVEYMEECLKYVDLHKNSITTYRAFNHVRRNDPGLFQNETGSSLEIMNRLLEKAKRIIKQGRKVHKRLKKYRNNIKPGPIYRPKKGIPSDPWITILEFCDNLFKKAKKDTEKVEKYEKYGYSERQADPLCKNHLHYFKFNQESLDTFKDMTYRVKDIDQVIDYLEQEKPEWERKRQALQQSEPSMEVNHQLKGIEMVLVYPEKLRILKATWQVLIRKSFDVFIYTMKTAIIRIVKRNYQHISPKYANDPDSVEFLLKDVLNWTVSTDEPLMRRCHPIENLQYYKYLDPFFKKLSRVAEKIRKDWEYLSQIIRWSLKYPKLKIYAEECLNEIKSTKEKEFGFIENFDFLVSQLFRSFINLDNAKIPIESERSRYRSSQPDEFDEQGNPRE